MSLVSAKEIQMVMRRNFVPDETDLAEMYIDLAISEIEAWLGRPVEVREFTENLWPDANGAVYFSQTPVQSVSEIAVDGTVVGNDYYTVTRYGLENVFGRTRSILHATPSSGVDTGGIYGPQITVTYCAGLDNPKAVKAIVIGAVKTKMLEDEASAARAEANALGVRRIEVEDFRVEYERSPGGSRSTGASNFTMFESEFDFHSIRRYKRRSFG